jgi:two-component system chemotaxis response regulator CheB
LHITPHYQEPLNLKPHTIILAISQDRLRDQVAAAIRMIPSANLAACTADLMNTFNEVEAHLPRLVVISSDLAAQTEFAAMHELFTSLNVKWLVLSLDGGQTAQNIGLPQLPATSSRRDLSATLQATLTGRPQSTIAGHRQTRAKPILAAPVPPKTATGQPAVILIGASTGGIDALISVLSQFGANCPPTLVVQHTGAGFGESLAALLDRQCHANVSLAKDGAPLEHGHIHIGAGLRRHLTLSDRGPLRCALVDGLPVSGHLPSVDMLFRSGTALGAKVTAALLTGMGRDGADGLLALRRAGAHTIAQDQESSVVYGMPRAATELGAASQILPLNQIGRALQALPIRPTPHMERARS